MPQGLFSGARPDLTPAMLVAGIPVLAELLHSFGVYSLSQAQQDSLSKALIFGAGLLGADAVVRVGRNLKDAKVESTALAQGGEAPIGPVGYQEGAPVEETPVDPNEIADLEYGDDLDLADEDLVEDEGPLGAPEELDDEEE